MTDMYTPSAAYGSRKASPIESTQPAEAIQLQQLSLNTRILAETNPWMADRPDLLMELAGSGLAPDQLATQGAALYGMQSMDALQGSISNLSPVAQRAVYAKLTETQQRSLDQMGYQQPGNEDGPGVLGEIAGKIGDVAAPVWGGVSAVGGPVLGGALDVLTWVGDQPAHLYRAIRQMDSWQQWVALGGAAAAVALAPVTFGASLGVAGTLASVGLLGGAAIGGATVAAAVTNPAEWWDALNTTWDGEKVFTKAAQLEARNLVGGDQYVALATELALDIDPYELVSEIAGERGSGDAQMMAAIERVASGMADPGSPEYQRVFAGLQTLVAQEPFLKAVDKLQQSKISFGRDVARTAGISPDNGMYGMVSGMIDGVWLVTMDPTMAVGSLVKWNRVRRFGVGTEGGEAFLQRLTHLSNTDRLTRFNHESIAQALTTGDFTRMPPAARGLWQPMKEYARANNIEEFARKDVLEFFSVGQGLDQMLQGKATIRGLEHAVISRRSESSAWGKFVVELRQFRDAADDVALEANMRRMADKHGVSSELAEWLPANVLNDAIHANIEDIGEVIDRGAGVGETLGRALAHVPGGRSAASLIASITSMAPGNKAIRIVGDGVEDDVQRLVETMGRAFNMPSTMRAEWLNATVNQGSGAQRMAVLQSFLDTAFTLGGMRSNDEVSKLADLYLHKNLQAYALGGLDQRSLSGIMAYTGVLPEAHQASLMVMPDIGEMIKAVRRGHIMKHIAKVSDHSFLETSMSKFWKPAVLLRIGFIPRAAGEELLGWMARATEGGIAQEYAARTIAERGAYNSAAARLITGETLSAAELQALNWQVPTHVRPLVRMASRVGWREPVETMLDGYGQMLRAHLDEGLGHTIPDVETLTMGPRVGAGKFSFQPTQSPQWHHGLLYGRQSSWRRGIVGGVDPILKEAADSWVKGNADAIMRATSSMNASVFEKSVVNPDVEYFMVDDPKNPGQFLEQPMVTFRGTRVRVDSGDERYASAIHHRLAEAFDDDIVGPVLTRMYAHYFPGFERLGKENVVEAVELSRKVEDRSARKLLLEGLEPRNDNWRAAADQMRNSDPLLASAIDDALMDGDVQWSTLLEAIERAAVAAPKTLDAKRLLAIHEQLTEVAPLIEGMDYLDPAARSWMAASLSSDVSRNGQMYDVDQMKKWASGTTETSSARPEAVLYRGVKDMETLEITPDGYLVMKAQDNADWGGDAISFSKFDDQSMTYAVSPGSFNSGSDVAFGAMIEVDQNYLLSSHGLTMQDLEARPVSYPVERDRGMLYDEGREQGFHLVGHEPGSVVRGRAMTDEDMGEVAYVTRGAGGSDGKRRELEEDIEYWEVFAWFDDDPSHGSRQVDSEFGAMERRTDEINSGANAFDYPDPLEFDQAGYFTDAAKRQLGIDSLDGGSWSTDALTTDQKAEVLKEVYRRTVDRFRSRLENFTEVASLPGELRIPPGKWAIQDQGQMEAVIEKVRAGQDTRWPWLADVEFQTPNGSNAGDVYQDFEREVGRIAEGYRDLLDRSPTQAMIAEARDETVASVLEYFETMDQGDLVWMGNQLGFNITGADDVMSQAWLRSFAANAASGDIGLQQFSEALTMRGKGGFQTELPSWTPFHDTRESFDRALEEEIMAQLMRPEHAEHVRRSRFTMETADGKRVAHLPQEGTQRIFQPVIGMNPRVMQTFEPHISAGLGPDQMVQNVVDDLLRQPEAYRLHADFIKKLPQEVRERAISDAVTVLIQRADGTTGKWTQPMSSLGYDDPRMAQWVSDVLTGGGSTDEVTRTAYVDIPRALGGSNEQLTTLGDAGRSWKISDEHAGNTAWIDGEDMVLLPDGSHAPGVAYTKALRDYARTIARKVATEHGARAQEIYAAKDVGDGLSGLARMRGDELTPLTAGERLGSREDLFDLEGNPVQWADSNFFDLSAEAGDDLLWPIIGPMMRDRVERPAGYMNIVSKSKKKDLNAFDRFEQVPQDQQMVNMTRSRVDDIHRTNALDLPNVALTEVRRATNENWWDRIVRQGFDKVIGPAVDAIVRTPMSFHYYATAYRQNMNFLDWMLDKDLLNVAVPRAFGSQLNLLEKATELSPAQLADGRIVARAFGANLADADATDVGRFIGSIGRDEEYVGELGKVIETARRRGDVELATAAERLAAFDPAPLQLLDAAGSSPASNRLVAAFHDQVPESLWESGIASVNNHIKIEKIGLPVLEEGDQWNTMSAAVNNYRWARHNVAETAKLRAIENVVPFLDSHEQRSQFAAINKNLLPFWYAEENFLKRWARVATLDGTMGLATIRKAQLGYMGVRSAGIVRTDANGKDWFVYPGSGLLAEALSKLPFIPDTLPLGVLFQSTTDSMLPGVNNRFGTPGVSPWVALPLDMTERMFPDAKPLKEAILGDFGSSQSSLKQFVPTTIKRVWEVAFQDETSSQKYASAMMSAAAMMEAEGNGLPDSATPDQVEGYMDRLRNHARVVMWAQVMTGFVTPGSPVAINTGDDIGSFGWLTGLGVESPGELVSDRYRSYIQNLGIDEGTSRFLADFPNADLEDVVNPLAFSVSTTASVSGARLPATELGVTWYEDNQGWVDSMPEAGAWFLPPDPDDSEFDYYSYNQQLQNGLRKRRNPEEFIRALKYRQGASAYFDTKQEFDDAVIRMGDDTTKKRMLDDAWNTWQTSWQAAHPIFAEELVSGEARQRRYRTIQQLRYAVDDPQAPDSPHLEAIREMSDGFEQYRLALMRFNESRSAASRDKVYALKTAFEEWATAWTLKNPKLEQMWSAVFRPEAFL